MEVRLSTGLSGVYWGFGGFGFHRVFRALKFGTVCGASPDGGSQECLWRGLRVRGSFSFGGQSPRRGGGLRVQYRGLNNYLYYFGGSLL